MIKIILTLPIYLFNTAPFFLDTVTQIRVTTPYADSKLSKILIASELGLDRAYGGLLPADKVEHFKAIKQHNQLVAFVGDGVNDAAVVAISDVGIAMGGLGSDATIETADMVIQDDKPSRIPTAIRIGKQTKRIVWQNIALASS